MKGKRFIGFVLLTMIVLGGVMPVMAEDMPKPQTYFRFSPIVNWDEVQTWRLGGQVELNYLLGTDKLQWDMDYSIHAKKINTSLLYFYNQDRDYKYYTNLVWDTRSNGLYGKEILWQDEHSAAIGAMKSEFQLQDGYYYIVDLNVKYQDITTHSTPNGVIFSDGRDLRVEPSLVGTYKGFLGNVGLLYGAPTSISDFNYLKASAYLKKDLKLTSKDKLVFSGGIGTVRGDYPVQERFYLGNSTYNITPNFKQKAIANLNAPQDLLLSPKVEFDGFEDGAFSGKNMFAGKVEYQRSLKAEFSQLLPYGFYPVAKVYTVFGNAFDGDVQAGLKDTHAAIGVGLNIEPAASGGFKTNNLYFGVNLARGLGEKAATTFGIEIGADITFLAF